LKSVIYGPGNFGETRACNGGRRGVAASMQLSIRSLRRNRNQPMRSNQSHCVGWGRTSLTVFAVILTASLAAAGSPKMAKDLSGKKGSAQVDVIVQFTQSPTARHHQKVLSKGGTLKNTLGLVNGGSYSVPLLWQLWPPIRRWLISHPITRSTARITVH
jgi:hypothetical protein